MTSLRIKKKRKGTKKFSLTSSTVDGDKPLFRTTVEPSYLESEKKRLTAIADRNNKQIVLVLVDRQTSKLRDLSHHTLAVNPDMSVARFMNVIRGALKLAPEMGLFFMVNGQMATPSELMGAQPTDEYGFVRIIYGEEHVFG